MTRIKEHKNPQKETKVVRFPSQTWNIYNINNILCIYSSCYTSIFLKKLMLKNYHERAMVITESELSTGATFSFLNVSVKLDKWLESNNVVSIIFVIWKKNLTSNLFKPIW